MGVGVEVDAVSSWTVRAMPKAMQSEVAIIAKRRNITVSVWLERVVREALEAERGDVIPVSDAQGTNDNAIVHHVLDRADHAEAVRLALEFAARDDAPRRDRLLRAIDARIRRMLRA